MNISCKDELQSLRQRIAQLEKSGKGRMLNRKEWHESRERFRNLVEATSDWVWEINNKRVYTYVSPKVFDILGYKTEEVIGKTRSTLCLRVRRYAWGPYLVQL